MFNSNQNYWATYYANEKFIIIQTESGCGRYMLDYIYSPNILKHEVDNEILGKAILQALANSRTFIYGSQEDEDFFDLEKSQQRYDNWVFNLCKQLGYQTKRTLFKKMKNGGVWLNNGKIKISSTRQIKLEAWDGINGVEDVVLSLDNSPEEIGAGLRLALSRCL